MEAVPWLALALLTVVVWHLGRRVARLEEYRRRREPEGDDW